jgi:chemotaxis protein methyltransferase CheR
MPEAPLSENFDIEVKLLVEAIFLKYGVDFRKYAFASVRRRMSVALARFDAHSLTELQARILNDASFFESFLELLTVSTSEMFRDPSYFQAIRTEVVPNLRTYSSFKVWIAGCSTGEEAYSMAILLQEEGLLNRAVIYATDINPRSLEKAQSGIFPLSQIPLYTANYQKAGGTRAFSDYYQAAYDSAIFDKTLRSQVLFSDHSLATDAVFAEVELISCRNVLIYFTRELQDHAFKLFTESLGNRGFLGLGSKETLRFSDAERAFEPLVPSEKIYRKKGLVG